MKFEGLALLRLVIIRMMEKLLLLEAWPLKRCSCGGTDGSSALYDKSCGCIVRVLNFVDDEW